MSLQTQDKLYRAVCFSPEKHQQCKTTSESSSPIKLTKYQLKRNTFTDQDEIHINKRSRLFEPASHEIGFDIQQLEPVKQEKSVEMTASEVLIRPANCKVNISGRITFQGPEETIISKGKTLRKQEALFTDNTASARIVLWENDIDKIATGNSYNLSNAVIRQYNQENYLCLNRQSAVAESFDTIEREDEQSLSSDNSLAKVFCPADGVQSIRRFLSCNKCQSKLAPISDKKIVKCSECGLAQLKSKCKQRLLANVIFPSEGSTKTLTLFDDKLRELYKLFLEQNAGAQAEFCSLDDDCMMEMILTVEAIIFVNTKNNVVAIGKKN